MTAKNIKHSNSPKSPSLRFPEFSEEWVEKYGNEIFENISDKNHNSDLPILAITQEYGAIPRDLIDYKVIVSDKSVDAYKVVQVGDFIISLRSFQGGIEYSNYKGICSPAYIILRPKIEIDRLFFKHYLKTTRYIAKLNKNLEGIRDGKMISYKYFSEIPLIFPSIPEQRKISNLFSKLDKRIEAQRELIHYYESLILGLSKMYFEKKDMDFNTKPLKTLCSIIKGQQLNTSELTEKGEFYVMNGGVVPSGYHSKYNVNENTISISEGGNSCGYIQFNTEKFWSGGHCYTLHDIDESIKLKYLYYFLKFREKHIMKLRVGGALPNIQKKDLESFEIKIPTIEYQNEIVEILDSISEKISVEKQLLTLYQEQKKYFLQNMFV